MKQGAVHLHAGGGAALGQRSPAPLSGLPHHWHRTPGGAAATPATTRSPPTAANATRSTSRTHAPRSRCRLKSLPHTTLGSARPTPSIACAASSAPPGIPTLTLATGFHAQYHLGDHLGQGSFATVHRAVSRHDSQEFAVKVVSKPPGPGKAMDRILDRVTKEVHAWSAVQHCEHVARLEGVYEDEAAVYIVQELCSGGDVRSLLEARGKLTERETAHLVKAMLSVVARCHSLGYSYGDVKPANLLLKHKYTSVEEHSRSVESGALVVKVVDFGCSQQATQFGGLQDRTGTPMYTAPEVFQHKPSLAQDVWSIGILMYQALTAQLPFWDVDMDAVRKKPMHDVVAGIQYNDMGLGYRWASRQLSPDALDLLAKLLERNKAERITAVAALAHPWLTKHCPTAADAPAQDAMLCDAQSAAEMPAFLTGFASNVVTVSASLAAASQPAQHA